MKSLYLTLCFFYAAVAAPLSQQAPKEMVDFMKQYGYLIDAGPDTDALYTKEAFSDAIKQMQKFGGIPETGVIDENTLKLMTLPRCGTKDVTEPGLLSNRAKRYVIGSKGWKKRTITYFVGNWHQDLSRETVMDQIRKAFDAWAEVSGLRFVQVNSTSADIVIAFARGDHGDGYAFDGQGLILAHAFFPYEHGSYGGDAHFDSDEPWFDGSLGKLKPGDSTVCCDFFTVAVHELGHSLGLAHSTESESIMFPYYKGYDPNFALAYDDMLAMYHLYIRHGKFEDEVSTEAPNTTTTTPTAGYTSRDISTTDYRYSDYYDDGSYSSTPFPSYPSYSTSRFPEDRTTKTPDKPIPSYPSYSTSRFPEERTTKTPDKPTTDKPPPAKCNGSFDAISLLRNELFIFKGPYMWRLQDRGANRLSNPVYFRLFLYQFLRSVRKIDAAYERRTDYKMLFFTGKHYWIFDGSKFTDDSPLPLSHLGLPENLESIDAALVWDKNQKTYFFSGEYYWRYDEINGKMDEGYPYPINRWRGVPPKLDSALTWKDGQTYFFKGNKYWRFNNDYVMVDENFPQSASEDWLGCVDTSGAGCFYC